MEEENAPLTQYSVIGAITGKFFDLAKYLLIDRNAEITAEDISYAKVYKYNEIKHGEANDSEIIDLLISRIGKISECEIEENFPENSYTVEKHEGDNNYWFVDYNICASNNDQELIEAANIIMVRNDNLVDLSRVTDSSIEVLAS